MVGRKKNVANGDEKSQKQLSTTQDNTIKETKKRNQKKKLLDCIIVKVNGQDLNPSLKGDKILNCVFHIPVEELFGQEKDEIQKGSILNVPLVYKNKKYSSLSCTVLNSEIEPVENPGLIMDIVEPEKSADETDELEDFNPIESTSSKKKKEIFEEEIDELNESAHSLSLKESVLTNLSYSLEKQNNIFKDFAEKSLETQVKLLEKQDERIDLLEKLVTQGFVRNNGSNLTAIEVPKTSRNGLNDKSSSSSSEEDDDEEDKAYIAFRDSFISLMKKKLPESAFEMDIKTLKLIYPEEMCEIEAPLKKLVNYRDETFKNYWKRATTHKRYLKHKSKMIIEKKVGKKD